MTKEQLTETFKELMAINPPKSEIERLFMKAIECGLLKYEDEESDSYRTSKIIYYAILCVMAEQWKPLDPANRREAEKLKSYLS